MNTIAAPVAPPAFTQADVEEAATLASEGAAGLRAMAARSDALAAALGRLETLWESDRPLFTAVVAYLRETLGPKALHRFTAQGIDDAIERERWRRTNFPTLQPCGRHAVADVCTCGT